MPRSSESPRFDKWVQGIRPNESVAVAVRYSLRSRLTSVQKFLTLAARPKQKDVEVVHQLRVATRRSLAVLELYRQVLPGKPARALRRTLKKIQRAAGASRDLDVLAKRYGEDEFRRSQRLVNLFGRRRAKAQKRLSRLHARIHRKNRLANRLNRLIQKIHATDALNERWDAWARLQWSQLVDQFFRSADVDPQDLAALHCFRILGKELRYAIELLAPVLAPPLLESAYADVEQLQERLGRINDHVVAREMFRQWSVQRNRTTAKFDLKRLSRDESEKLQLELLDFQAWWTPIIRAEMRQVFDQLAPLDPHV